MTSKSLKETLNDFLNPTPNFQDPEDDINVESSAISIHLDSALHLENKSNDESVIRSNLRSENAPLLVDISDRYSGKKVNRTQLSSSDDEYRKRHESVEDEDEDLDNEEDEEEEEDDEELEDEEDNDEEENEESQDIEKQADDLQKFSTFDDENEIEKGKHVNNQLLIWDSLLESRIKLQKVIGNSNKLPQHDIFPKFESNQEFHLLRRQTTHEITKLLTSLLTLEESIKNKSKSVPSNSEGCSEEEDEILSEEEKIDESETNEEGRKKRKFSEYQNFLCKRHKDLIYPRDTIINQWSEKTRYATLGGKINKNSLEAVEQSTVKLIEQILSNRDRLIKRTQFKRSVYETLGKLKGVLDNDEETSRDPEIFDDDDFYHQLLREIIENKMSSETNDPVALSRKWLQIQKIRNKSKKKVDTKASKGRKTRYDVHKELVNFMAPMQYDSYTEHAKTELFASLFGKRKEYE